MKINIRKKSIPLIATGLISLMGNPVNSTEIELAGLNKATLPVQEFTGRRLEEEKEQEILEGETQIEVQKEETSTYHGIEYETIKVCTDDLNVRKFPTTESEVLGTLPVGTKITEQSHQEGWYKISYLDGTGYVSDSYITEKTKIKGDPKKIVYINNNISLLDPQTREYKTTLPWLDTAEVYGEEDYYYLVNTTEGIGLVSKEATTELTGTYVIVDISDQVLKLYEDSNLLLETPVVTGKNSTPSDMGLFNIYWKEQCTNLTGPGYSSYVNYWMPYNGGEGLHDATWRYEFGGDIYENYGSHGCVNMPLDAAGTAYSLLEQGDKVLVKN